LAQFDVIFLVDDEWPFQFSTFGAFVEHALHLVEDLAADGDHSFDFDQLSQMNVPEISDLVDEGEIGDFDIGLRDKGFICGIIATGDSICYIIKSGQN
jgi:hypothetical protein